MESLKLDAAFASWSGVRCVAGNTQVAFAGDETGRVLTVDCPWATRETAEALLVRIRGRDYQPFAASNALIDPAAEPGDVTVLSGATGPAARMEITLDGLYTADISAPGEEAVNRDYPVLSDETEEAAGSGEGVERLTDDVDRIQDDIDGLENDVDQIANTIGDPVILRQITTDALYGKYGEISDLSVNRLSTSRRIVKYLNQDRSDDNFIRIQNQELEFVTGECTGNREQAKTPAGDLLYWSRKISGLSRDAEGYPISNDGERVFILTTPTDWPVYIYIYQEAVKRRVHFELNSGNHIYEPVDIYGAGNAQGYNYGKIAKTTNGFDLLYINPSGKEIGVKMGSDGYMDLVGSRKTTQLNFSNWNNGTFTEKRDGLSNTLSYQVAFDNNKRPVKITDPSGHETVITW